ncbi:hypothetical protein Tsubulata_027369 [Turnera subulata]|uniref:Glycosyltransferase n=1 Tax=Turnera subulata TaxID=218843 RepID=A0A9Q0FN05_9ROSI|nr:hypothetical protein Tsubulata_027369 [Turnera subulata]
MSPAAASDELHIAMFPWFAFGHISPFVQLSNKLALHGVRISFLTAPGNIPRIKSSLLLTPKTQIISLPIPPVEGLPPGLDSTSEMTPAMAEALKKALDLMQPQVKTLLSQLKPHLVVFDFAQYWVPKIASELGVKSLQFSVYSAVSGGYLIVPVRTSGNKNPTVEDLMKPPEGFPSTSIVSVERFQAENFLYVYKSFDGSPSVYSRSLEIIRDCDAIIIKTCNELEGPYVDHMRTQYQKQILLSGPLVPEPPSGQLEERWAKWLDQFPSKSVVYCSFGSETFLSDDQIRELSLGLELTGLPFFLVLNFPPDFNNKDAKLAGVLPQGFQERVKDRGIVHTGWVQQQLILAHDSVGCYFCHSGFSSVIEAFINDCQLVLLPLKGDQFLNSKLIAGDMKAGVEVNRRGEDGYFGREDVSDAVKTLMVDIDKDPCMSLRANHRKWGEFLQNGEIQAKFIANLVEELKAL